LKKIKQGKAIKKMQEEKQNDDYPNCKKTCKMCYYLPESKELVCTWLPCYYKQIKAAANNNT